MAMFLGGLFGEYFRASFRSGTVPDTVYTSLSQGSGMLCGKIGIQFYYVSHFVVVSLKHQIELHHQLFFMYRYPDLAGSEIAKVSKRRSRSIIKLWIQNQSFPAENRKKLKGASHRIFRILF
jgi:hypothetical protein